MSGFDRPPARLLTLARVRGLLAWLSHRSRLDEGALARVPALIDAVEVEIRDWARDPWLHFPDGEGLWFRVDAACQCDTHVRTGFCEHRAAIVVLALWQRPDGRELFERPTWQLELDYLLRENQTDAHGRPRAPEALAHAHHWGDRPGRLQLQVFSTGGYAQGFDVEARLLRANKRGDGWLKPIRCPTELDKLRAKAKLDDASLRVVEQLNGLAELRKIDTFARLAPKLRARLAHDLLAALADAGDAIDLTWEQRPIRASTEPWSPSLRVSAGAPGKLEVRWVEPVLDHWQLEPAIVLTGQGVLQPVATDVPTRLLDRMDAVPVELGLDEFDAFARTILAHAPVAIEIPEPQSVGAAVVTRREGRVYLSERGAILRCTAKLAYELADGRCLEFPLDDQRGMSLADDARVLIRELGWERSCRAQFREQVSRRGDVELIAEDAWRFLSEGLAALREQGWVAFGENQLSHNRVLPQPLGARMRIGPSTDWFDLEVDFVAEGGGTVVDAPAVIESWLAGQRFVRLPDARVAALPSRWLERHARALAELTEMRLDAKQGLGAHALPLAAELLDEHHSDDPEQRERAAHWRGRANTLASFEHVAEREPPADLNAELRPYQRRGFAWLCSLRDHGLAGCLADDMGLGKTVQTLALLLDTHTQPGTPSLVVCPTSVLHTWREQAARFAPRLRVHLHHGPRRGELPADAEVDVILTSYALLRQDAEQWRERGFRHLIFDEAQALKNPDSQLAKVARSIAAAHPVALTGTPLENHVFELWSLFETLMPGFFGSRRRFRKRYADAIHGSSREGPASAGERGHEDQREDAVALARLRRRVRPFLLRRLKREVATELPPKQVQILRCRLGKEQRAMYERVRQSYRASVFGAVDQKGMAGATLHILEALTRLRQACCDPALLPFPEAREHAGRVAKLELLRLLLEQAIADRHRSLVFSQWPSFLDRVAASLDAAGIAYLRLDGGTRDRGAVLKRWQDPSGPAVFLISTKAGGLGLDLTEADHVFHLDPWWNPAAEDQATDRAHRIGQTRPVMVYKLVAADTVEDKILELQARKRRLFAATVDTDRLEVDALRREDLEAVFGEPLVEFETGDEDDDEDPGLDIDPRSYAEFVPLPIDDRSLSSVAGDGDGGEVIELFRKR